MTEQTLIQFDNVSKIYSNGTVGLKDINLDIKQGEFIVIVGLSGAGKSTLLRTINRMHDVTNGDIMVNGDSIIKLKGRKLRHLRRQVGMIFQNFNLVNKATVERNVLSGRVGYYPLWQTLFGYFSQSDKTDAANALKRVNLLEKLYTRADQLSGGQQQRVAIARAMMQTPKVLLADEPIASLDPLTAETVMTDLKSLNEELGITVIVNLHSMSLAQKYADRIIGLRAGELVYDELIETVTKSDLEAIYHEQPKSEEVS